MQTRESQLPIPRNGSGLQSFMDWEAAAMEQFRVGELSEPVLAIWQSALGISITQKERRLPFFKEKFEAQNSINKDIVIRRSGGTAVPQGDGIINVSWIYRSSSPRNIKLSFLKFCQHLQTALDDIGCTTQIGAVKGSYCDGDYNLIASGKKLVGTSQRWANGPNGHSIILNHAVMMVSANAAEQTDRVNAFYKDAGSDVRFDRESSTSLIDAVKSKKSLSKDRFWSAIEESLQKSFYYIQSGNQAAA